MRETHRPAREFFDLLQNLVDSINGVKDEHGFLTTVLMNVRVTVGTASPAGVVNGAIGDLFIQKDGAALTTFWVKEAGTDAIPSTAGWAAK